MALAAAKTFSSIQFVRNLENFPTKLAFTCHSCLQKRGFNSSPVVGTVTKSDDYQFLDKSKTPTYHFQPGLMRLPIPKLEQTCERNQKLEKGYLTGVRPFLSEEQHEKASQLTKHFLANDGPELQKELKAYDKRNKHTSYINEPWTDVYLRDRKCLPIKNNPVMAFAFDPDKRYNDQLTRATNMTISIGRFKRSLDAEVLTPEIFHLNPKKSDTEKFRTITRLTPRQLSFMVAAFMFKAYPLDMSQHSSLFNSTRIPLVGKDQIVGDSSAKHILVMRKGHPFTARLFHDDGTLVNPGEMHTSLSYIMNLPLEEVEHPIGMFTTMDRDEWARARKELLRNFSVKFRSGLICKFQPR